MTNRKRILEQLAEHYSKKLSGKVWATWDETKRAYSIQGEGLPSHPDLREQYPNGWSLLDYIKPSEARKVLNMPVEQNNKRILSVTIKRMHDNSPDTSWLGEYANSATSEYSIDRAHSEDCIENDSIQKAKLERIADWIENEIPNCEAHPDFFSMDCATCDVEAAYKDAETTVRELLVCDCGEHGDMERGQYSYFNGNVENYKGESPADIRKYVRQDYERMESLNAGNWCFIGIRAEADVQTAHGAVIQTISSGGLWGIESDAGDDHIKSTIDEELDSLKTELTALGFSKRAIATAFKDVQESE